MSGAGDFMLEVFIGLMVFYLLILIPLCVLMVIAEWKMFKKAGEPGWKCLIPGYNLYIYLKISTLKRPLLHTIVYGAYAMAVITVMTTVSTVSMISTGIPVNSREYIEWFLKFYLTEMLALLPIIVLNAIVYIKLAKAFGKSAGFGIGLFFLNGIFLLILGFGKAKYLYKPEEPAVPQVECAEPAALPESALAATQPESAEPEEGSGQSSESMKQKNEQTKLEGEV